jgi:colanic acid/amylovoran biosynthesis glycosyltransferase
MAEPKKIRLALISPAKDAYSETFIQAHRKYIDADISFYYGGRLPGYLDEGLCIATVSLFKRICYWLRIGCIRKLNYFEWCLYHSFRKRKIEVVLAEYGPTGAECLNVCKALDLPLIVHFHGYDAHLRPIVDLYADRYRAMFSYARSIVSVSSTMTAALVNLGCPPEKVGYNPYGPDDSFFEVQPDYSEKLFVGLGRFVDKKAPYYTILAFKKVRDQHPDARLVIGGDGPLLETCRNLVKALGLTKAGELPGPLSRVQFQGLLSRAIAFVQHSITTENGDMEGTPVAILEAMAAGVPVIATRHAGIRDVVEDDMSMLLCKEHDVIDMATKMGWLIDNQEMILYFGQKARKRIDDGYRIQRHISELNKSIAPV